MIVLGLGACTPSKREKARYVHVGMPELLQRSPSQVTIELIHIEEMPTADHPSMLYWRTDTGVREFLKFDSGDSNVIRAAQKFRTGGVYIFPADLK